MQTPFDLIPAETEEGTPEFALLVERVEAQVLDRLNRGEFGVLAKFKEAAPEAVDVMIATMRQKKDPKLAHAAAKDVIAASGFHAPKPPTTEESPERLIDLMTAEEARHFADTGEFPDRFKDQLARLAVNVIRAREDTGWTPRIERVEVTSGVQIEEGKI